MGGLTAGYRFGSVVVDVEADDPNAARWLLEFLTPWFEPHHPGQGELKVRLTCSASAFDAFEQRRLAVAVHPIACFGLDSQVVTLPGWMEAGGWTVMADPACGCFYRLRPPHVEIVARPGSRRVRLGIMRVVREFAAARTLAESHIVDLHAAAFAVGGHAVLIVGPKRAGKTTFLVHALTSGRASLLANDRVFVDAGRHPARALGMPTLVSLRDDTLRFFPRLRDGFPERPALLHAGEMQSRDVAAANDGNAPAGFALSPTQLARRLGVEIVRCAPIAAIVFPEISATAGAWSLEPVAPPDGSVRLRHCLYGARSGFRARTVFGEFAGDTGNRHEKRTALLDRLTSRLPLFRCRLGPDAYPDSSAAWLRALPLEASSGARVA